MIQDRIYNYFERNPQLKVLFIFDRLGGMEAELTEVSWPEEYVFKKFDGKWFNLKLSISRDWADKRVVLLFPSELRPDTEEKRLNFPLLDVYASNVEFKDERHEEFMQQYGIPDSFGVFVKNNMEALSSPKVLAMLAGYLNAEDFRKDTVYRAIVSWYLSDKKLLDWESIIVKMIILSSKGEEKKSLDFFYRLQKVENRETLKAINDKLIDIFNVTFNPNVADKMREVAEVLKYNAITQSLNVLSADDYRTLKITSRLKLDQINRIYEKGMSEPAYCEKFKRAMNELASGIRETELIKVYGTEAPFFYMTDKISIPLIEKIIKDNVSADPMTVIEKMRSLSLRLGENSQLMPLVRFVENCSTLYDAMSRITTFRLDTPKEYIDTYIETFSKIDRYYRHVVDTYYELPELDGDIAAAVSELKHTTDVKYTQIVNTFNIEWLDCVKEAGKPLNKLRTLPQNEFFSTYYTPQRLVVIISDALRYEVAEELLERLAAKKHMATLSPMLSLIPSETKICKPALFPHTTLSLVDSSVAVDNKVLASTKQRGEQLERYKEGAVCVNFDDVCTQVNSHRELFKCPLVYVMHDRIDNIGHDQNPKDITETCKKTVEELAKFIYSLHMSLNCYNVIVTSDHGFLFNDLKFEEKDKISIKDETFDSTTRYYLTTNASPVDEMVKFNLSENTDIKTAEGVYVATPKGTNRFAAPGGYKFCHGGASLQEMIIPIIHSNRRDENSKQLINVVLKSNNLSMTSSRLRFQLVQKEAVSMDMVAREVVCRVYEGDRIVTDEVRLVLNSTDALNISKRTYDVTLRLTESVSGGLLQLRVLNVTREKNGSEKIDSLNPLIKETVKNNTIIEQDF
ncbi:PglZ domain-containing protein [uncultured Duncaniella sp.]|jgi:hypothetical protein|uniref:PglZ domain-containing protein n=1 Tax=uncultured Duncaniella sp. TaxID=2768039 RepID=UPI000F486A77|nr:PglZ domain-containing protein [uncultured Duncaniella sp.]ROT16597.1 PglZ domain-containing protein [Muribaculaceae bacterium Isolate-105 (HZI)]